MAIIGEMLELGVASPKLHRAAGAEAARSHVSALIAVGGANAQAIAEGAIEAGMAASRVHYVKTSGEAADLAAKLVTSGDVVLVKGSRGIRTEVVVDRLKAEFA
jgi:UDP-N-acetylmuramoyl-tripeptide--D-alanyl-D-alanine ligase